jgi:hypothetical protein
MLGISNHTVHRTWEVVSMNVASLNQDLYGFAIELRRLAYTMPGGHEDPLIRLSERMIHHAEQGRKR